VKRFLLAALFAMAVVPTSAQATPIDECQPYPECCVFEPNPWQCLGGEADASFPVGNKCAFNSTTDVTREAGWQTGDIRVGPLVTAEAGWVECTIIVNANIHNSPNVRATARFDATAGLVVAGAGTLNYQATAADDVALCTTWHGAGGTRYWVSGSPTAGVLGHWSPNPGTCGVALSIEPNDPECSIWLAIDQRLGTNIAEIWQDCETYEPFPLPI
jgi:hypothetical protein